jgi:hypothetical protein
MTPELPFTYPSYINPHFRPHEPHLRMLALDRKRRDQEWEFTCGFREKRGFCLSFQYFSSHRSLWSEKNFSKYENLKFSHNFQTQGILSSNFKLFRSSNPMRRTFSSQIVKTYFQPNIMKYISESNETCFFMIQNKNPIIWSQVQFFYFLVEFSSPVHDFGCSSILSSLWV